MHTVTERLVTELDNIRRQRGWDITETAKACGMAPSSLHALFSRRTIGARLTVRTVDRLMAGFGVDAARMQALTTPATEPVEPETPAEKPTNGAPSLNTLVTLWRQLDADSKDTLIELAAELVSES